MINKAVVYSMELFYSPEKATYFLLHDVYYSLAVNEMHGIRKRCCGK